MVCLKNKTGVHTERTEKTEGGFSPGTPWERLVTSNFSRQVFSKPKEVSHRVHRGRRETPGERHTPRNAWKRRLLSWHVSSFSGRALSLASFSSVFSVPSVRTLFLIFGTNETGGIAPSRKERALTPRCPPSKTYRAVAKRRRACASMTVESARRFEAT